MLDNQIINKKIFDIKENYKNLDENIFFRLF